MGNGWKLTTFTTGSDPRNGERSVLVQVQRKSPDTGSVETLQFLCFGDEGLVESDSQALERIRAACREFLGGAGHEAPAPPPTL